MLVGFKMESYKSFLVYMIISCGVGTAIVSEESKALRFINAHTVSEGDLVLNERSVSVYSKGHKLSKVIKQSNIRTTYPSNSTYDSIAFECQAPFAINWAFAKSPIDEKYVDYIKISTKRILLPYNESHYNYNFTSVLHLQFTNYPEKTLPFNGSICCQSFYAFLSSKNSWLEVSESTDSFSNPTLSVKSVGPKYYNVEVEKPGKNSFGRAELIVDADNNEIECRWKSHNGSTEFRNITLRKVNNIMEIEALITSRNLKFSDGKCAANCTLCISIGKDISVAVLVCGYGKNSLSAPIFRRGSDLYFDFDEYKRTQDSSDHLIWKKNETFQNDLNYEFVCEGSSILFTHGFVWILERNSSNSTMDYRGNGEEESLNNTILSKINVTFAHAEVYTVYCLAPFWDSTSWSEVKTTVQIEPKYVNDEYNSNVSTSHSNTSAPSEDINSTSSSTTTASITEKSGLNDKEMIIIAVSSSVVVVIMLLCAILLFIALRTIKRQSRQLRLITEEEIDEFQKGNPKAENALFLPYNMDFEIPREKLQIGNVVLGDGNFGIVQKGKYGTLQVAVKTVKKSADGLYFKSLLSELKIMSYVGRHINIVHLVGACTKDLRKGYVCLVYEFCTNGNMQQYLRKSRKSFTLSTKLLKSKTLDAPCRDKRKSRLTSWMEPSPSSSTFAEKLSMKDLILWSQQIASGMEYISSKNIIHGDLAARNVLITDKMQAKLGDFGLSKQLFDYSIYIQKQHCPLPLKWMAPESLRDMEFSVQSDVWSYGITLWEIYSLGEMPYPGVDWNYESWKMLRDGFRMERPQHAHPVLFNIILECWKNNPSLRPTFTFLKNYFNVELEKILLVPTPTDKTIDSLWL